MSNELKIIDRLYDLIVWTQEHVNRFPAHARFALGDRLNGKLLTCLDRLLEAKFSKDKIEPLEQAAFALEQARFLFRICKDTRILAFSSHEHSVELMVDIGRQLQGWRKHNGAAP